MSDDRRYKSVDLSLEWSKQLMALATGTLVLSATFVNDLFGNEIIYPWVLVAVWALLILSMLIGMVFLGALCSLIDDHERTITIYSGPVRWLALLHFASFLFAIILFTIFNSINLLC